MEHKVFRYGAWVTTYSDTDKCKHKLPCVAVNFRYWYFDNCERKRYQNGASHDWMVKLGFGDEGQFRVNVY